MKRALFPMLVLAPLAFADIRDELAECAVLTDDTTRLACYDDLGSAAAADESGAPGGPSSGEKPVIAAEADTDLLAAQRMAREDRTASSRWEITPHLRNYLLPLTHNSRPNNAPYQRAGNDGEDNGIGASNLDELEVKFQLSIKAILMRDLLGGRADLWARYTQQSWWQAYNTDESSPFRETNYQPEVAFVLRNDWELFGFTNTALGVSLSHQSNGRSGSLSRSWNRVIGSAVFERDGFSLIGRAWHRLPEDRERDDNPDIDDYLGYGDLTGVLKHGKHEWSLQIRNTLDGDGLGSYQFDWTYPLNDRFDVYLQYFNGYGESLIDYDERTNRIGIGVSLTDLL
jgi:phospholipase A1